MIEYTTFSYRLFNKTKLYHNLTKKKHKKDKEKHLSKNHIIVIHQYKNNFKLFTTLVPNIYNKISILYNEKYLTLSKALSIDYLSYLIHMKNGYSKEKKIQKIYKFADHRII